jgi:hypothetical protein
MEAHGSSSPASARGHQVAFEVGLEKQSSDADDPGEFHEKLECIVGSLFKVSLPSPTFVVGQIGTKVVGTENCGAVVHEPQRVGSAIRELALKAHKVDYLPGYAIRELIRNGTGAINIAPEFGMIETSAFLALLDRLQLAELRDDFLQLAYESGAWRKWFDDGDATDLQRCVAAGHYVFATNAFREIKQRADVACSKQTRTVDSVLEAALDRAMERYAPEVWDAEHGTA